MLNNAQKMFGGGVLWTLGDNTTPLKQGNPLSKHGNDNISHKLKWRENRYAIKTSAK